MDDLIFRIDKIYVKDLSLEVPDAPDVFFKQLQANIDLKIDYVTNTVGDDSYHFILSAVVRADVEGKQLFLIEIQQACIFYVKNIIAEQMQYFQNVEFPTILFPYLREEVSNISVKAGFLPVVLAPINFAYMYQQKSDTNNHATLH